MDGIGFIKIKWTTKAPGVIQYSKILQILAFFFLYVHFIFCEQLEPGLIPQSYLHFKLFGVQNGCLMVAY